MPSFCTRRLERVRRSCCPHRMYDILCCFIPSFTRKDTRSRAESTPELSRALSDVATDVVELWPSILAASSSAQPPDPCRPCKPFPSCERPVCTLSPPEGARRCATQSNEFSFHFFLECIRRECKCVTSTGRLAGKESDSELFDCPSRYLKRTQNALEVRHPDNLHAGQPPLPPLRFELKVMRCGRVVREGDISMSARIRPEHVHSKSRTEPIMANCTIYIFFCFSLKGCMRCGRTFGRLQKHNLASPRHPKALRGRLPRLASVRLHGEGTSAHRLPVGSSDLVRPPPRHNDVHPRRRCKDTRR